MKIYLDACCYGRPYDDLSQVVGIKAEYAAILSVIHVCEVEGFPIFGSPMLTLEISKIPDDETRQSVMNFYVETVTKKNSANRTGRNTGSRVAGRRVEKNGFIPRGIIRICRR